MRDRPWFWALVTFLIGIGVDVSPLQSWWLTAPLWGLSALLVVWWTLPFLRRVRPQWPFRIERAPEDTAEVIELRGQLRAAEAAAAAAEASRTRLRDEVLPTWQRSAADAASERDEWRARYEAAVAPRAPFGAGAITAELREDGWHRWYIDFENVSGDALTNILARLQFADGDGDDRGAVMDAVLEGNTQLLPSGGRIRLLVLERQWGTVLRRAPTSEGEFVEIQQIASHVTITFFSDGGARQEFKYNIGTLHNPDQGVRVAAE